MYQSRLHITNGIISVALDALNGEMLEFTRENTWDNALKNHIQQVGGLMDAILHTEGGDKRITVPRYLDIRRDAGLTPRVTVEQGENEASARMEYPYLVSDGHRVDIGAVITLSLRPGDCRSYWKLRLINRTENELDDVAFPVLDGAWLGETWQDDVLAFPRFAGWQVENPTKALAETPPQITWKWQEYLFRYNLGQAFGQKDKRGAYVLRLNYSGEASMVWMDLYDPKEKTGIYMTCRNTALRMKALRMEAFGEQNPGAGMAIIHIPCLKQGEWESEECVIAFHEGDWHWGADEYRAWFDTLPRPALTHHRPKWFEESAGLIAHYDFQYQGGGIVHTFRDIPHLMEMAQAMGFNHLLLSGWNEDGFDFGFPHYAPNHRLGTPEDLKNALSKVKEMGGHVAFYVNSRLCNTGFKDEQERIAKSAVMRRDGSLHIEKYGADDIEFASLCINDTAWRHSLRDTVDYLTHEIGADSMYLDQFAMATSCKCYHPGHTEHTGDPAAWNQGYEKLLMEMRESYDPDGMALIFEGCNDAFGPYASGQLITTLGGPFMGRTPEIYKYTFPEQILADMMNPRRNSAMRAEHVARHSTEFLYKAFTVGAYLWCYDLEWDNTWRRDPEQYERLKKVVALRTKWLKTYGHGLFRDDRGILKAPVGPFIKRFDLEDGLLLACAAESGLKGCVAVEWPLNGKPRAEKMTLEQPEPLPYPCEVTEISGKRCAFITLPETEAAVIRLTHD